MTKNELHNVEFEIVTPYGYVVARGTASLRAETAGQAAKTVRDLLRGGAPHDRHVRCYGGKRGVKSEGWGLAQAPLHEAVMPRAGGL